MSKRAQVSWTLGASIIAAFAGVLATRLFDRGLAPSGGRTTRVIAMAPLTDLPGHQQSPSLSSDGKMLLFVARDGLDSDVFLLRVGGENPVNLTEDHLGDDEDPAFSPDGERIAFRSEREGGGIFVMGATGESPRKLTSEGAHPAWSPDGRQIAYSTEHVGNPTARLTTSSLWLVDVSTGEAKRLYEGDAVQPAWSPSGRRIVFWAADQGQRDIRTIAAEGGPVSDVTRDPATDWGAFWAPDGRSIFFLSDRGGSPDLWRVAIDEGSGRPRGEPQPVTTGVARVTAGSISADGSRVAIEVVEARGEILKLGFDPVQARVRGTPDLVFASGNPIVQTSLAPAGDWIAYRTTAPAENIFVMRSDGSERRRLTDDSFRNRGPRWVRGSEWLIFYTNRTGDYEPWLMRRDGTELRRLTDQPKSEVTQPVVSPDGNGVVFSVGGTLPRLGFTSLGDEWFVPGKPPAPVKFELVAEDFIPNAWAPDGERILGTTASGTDRRLAIYSTATRRVELFEHLRAAGGTWLPDSRRILCVGSRRRSAVVWDVVSQQVQEVPGFSGFSGDLRLSSDGRTLVMTRNVTEGDIWLLTLK
jgi:Tol biopolymer transport system component